MKNIIKKIAETCNQFATFKKTSWHELSLDEQLSLFENGSYSQIKKVMKHQKIDDRVLTLLVDSCLDDEFDYDYKLLCYYYRKYGFSNAIKLAILCPKEIFEFSIAQEIIQEYGFGPRLNENGELKLISDDLLVVELLGYGDTEICNFFASTRKWYQTLKIYREAQIIRDCMYASVTYGTDSPWDLFINGYCYPTTEDMQTNFPMVFPSHAMQDAVLASKNEEWIVTLNFLIKLSIAVSFDLFQMFDESLLSEQTEMKLNA